LHHALCNGVPPWHHRWIPADDDANDGSDVHGFWGDYVRRLHHNLRLLQNLYQPIQ
ncbi:hypothetical protein ACJMK2_031421, partial [Sinanodonta woodiana]